MEKDAGIVIANKTNTLQAPHVVGFEKVGGLLNTKAGGDWTDGEGGNGVEHEVLVEVKGVCVAG